MSKNWHTILYNDKRRTEPSIKCLYMPDGGILELDTPSSHSNEYTAIWGHTEVKISGDLTWEEAQDEAIRLITDVIKERINRLQADLAFLDGP